MEEQTFNIDQTQLNSLVRKTQIRQLSIPVIAMAIFFWIPIIQQHLAFNMLLSAFLLFIVGIVLLFVVNRLFVKRMYESYVLTLDSEGISVQAQFGVRYKMIVWTDLAVEETNNGNLNVFDKSFSPILKQWSGRSFILIPLEIDNREGLLAELQPYLVNKK